MNNSFFAVENAALATQKTEDIIPFLREREQELVSLIKAIREVYGSDAWSSLKIKLFDGLVLKLKKDLENEAKKEAPDDKKLNRIAGQLLWAEKYSDLTKLENDYSIELKSIRQKLHGTT